jgi:serine/threonine protein kinase
MKLESGSKIGHYKIISPIGKGGMGEVFLAQDTKLNSKSRYQKRITFQEFVETDEVAGVIGKKAITLTR